MKLHLIHQAAWARRQRRDLLIFESSCHLSTTYDGGFTLSLELQNVKQGSCEYQFLWYLVWPYRESNSGLPFQLQMLYPLYEYVCSENSRYFSSYFLVEVTLAHIIENQKNTCVCNAAVSRNFGEFVVMSLKTYGNSLISTCSIFNDNNNNNNNIEYDIKRSSGIYTGSEQRKAKTKTR